MSKPINISVRVMTNMHSNMTTCIKYSKTKVQSVVTFNRDTLD